MNWIVITIGTALVLALFAALVGPVLVDWTAYRDTIEANASRFLGTEVTIDGEADFRILPTPRVRLTDVRIGSEADPFIRADAVVLDVDLAPLLSREFRVLGLRLEKPVATVSLDRSGALALPDLTVDSRFTSFFDMDHITVQEISVAAGEVNLIDRRSGRSTRITGIDMTGDARTLRGPYAAAGSATIGGVRQSVRIGGGIMESGTMPLSARINPENGKLALSFEGALVPRPARLSLRGQVSAESSASTPWSVRGTLSANTREVQLQAATVRYGAADQALELAANATYSLVENDPVAIALEGRQIDLDRLARSLAPPPASGDPIGTPSPDEILPLLAAYLAPAGRAIGAHQALDLPLDLELAVNTVLAGGSVIRDVSAEAAVGPETITLNRAEAVFPGDTTVDLSGRIAEAFEGTVNVSASQPALLARWWTGTGFTRGPMDPVLLEADIRATRDSFDAQRLSLRIGNSSATGRASYSGGGEPVLDIAMTAPRLDLADVADAGAVLTAAGAGLGTMPEILLDLSVGAVSLGGVEGAALSVDGSYRDGALTIDAISAEDLAGARLFARGEIQGLGGDPAGVIEGSLDVEEGAKLAAAIRAFAPGNPHAAAIAARINALAPAALDIALTGRPGENGADLSLGVDGTLGGTALTLKALAPVPDADWRLSPSALSVDAQNDNGAALLRQFGLAAAESAGPARVTVDLAADAGASLAGRIAFEGLGVDAVFDGTLGREGGLSPTGRFALTADELDTLAAALDTALPAAGGIDLAATLAPSGGGIAIDGLKGTVDEVAVSGDLIANLAGEPATIAGSLAIGEGSLDALAGLALGSPLESDGGDWATMALAAPLLPAADIALDVAAGTFDIGSETLTDVTFTFAADRDGLAIRNAKGRFAEGSATGTLEIDRRGAAADVNLSLALEDAALGGLVWTADGAPVATGTLSLTAEASGAGYTAAGIVASLAGEGSLHLRDATLAGLNGAPFQLLSALPEDGEPMPEAEVADAFAAHLGAGSLAIPSLDVPLTMTGGTVSIRDVALSDGEMQAIASARIDLAATLIQSEWSIALQAPDESPVAVSLRFSGPLADPERTIDVSALSAWLSLRALERQVEAVEAQNAELEAEADAVSPALPGDTPAEGAAPVPEADPAPAQPSDGIADLIDGNGAEEPDAGRADEAPPLPPAPPGERSSLPADNATAALGDPAGIAAQAEALDADIAALEARRSGQETVRAELLRRLGVDPDSVPSRAFAPE